MDFFTFFAYFIVSHFVYTIVATIIGTIYETYRRNKLEKEFIKYMKENSISLEQIEDGIPWH